MVSKICLSSPSTTITISHFFNNLPNMLLRWQFSSYFSLQKKANTQLGLCSSSDKVVMEVSFFLPFSKFFFLFSWKQFVPLQPILCSICIHFLRVFKSNRRLFSFIWLCYVPRIEIGLVVPTRSFTKHFRLHRKKVLNSANIRSTRRWKSKWSNESIFLAVYYWQSNGNWIRRQ